MFLQIILRETRTLVVQLCSVLRESFQPNSLTEKIQKLVQRRAGVLIIIHLFFCALTRFTVQDAHFVLETELQKNQNHRLHTATEHQSNHSTPEECKNNMGQKMGHFQGL